MKLFYLESAMLIPLPGKAHMPFERLLFSLVQQALNPCRFEKPGLSVPLQSGSRSLQKHFVPPEWSLARLAAGDPLFNSLCSRLLKQTPKIMFYSEKSFAAAASQTRPAATPHPMTSHARDSGRRSNIRCLINVRFK